MEVTKIMNDKYKVDSIIIEGIESTDEYKENSYTELRVVEDDESKESLKKSTPSEPVERKCKNCLVFILCENNYCPLAGGFLDPEFPACACFSNPSNNK